MNTTIARPVPAGFRPSLRVSSNRLVIAGRALSAIVAALDEVDS